MQFPRGRGHYAIKHGAQTADEPQDALLATGQHGLLLKIQGNQKVKVRV